MTPVNIAGFAKLNGIDLLAVTDHNSALNLPAVQKACELYGVLLLPGLEVTTQEEIHVLTYFKTVKQALEFGELLYQKLPAYPYEKEIWGKQLVMDHHENIIHEPKKLLTGATELTIYEVKRLCEERNGLVIPAHIDKDSTSLLSVLGFAPEDLPFDIFEVKRPEHTLNKILQMQQIPAGKEILTSSDAHQLTDIPEHPRRLEKNSLIKKFLGI